MEKIRDESNSRHCFMHRSVRELIPNHSMISTPLIIVAHIPSSQYIRRIESTFSPHRSSCTNSSMYRTDRSCESSKRIHSWIFDIESFLVISVSMYFTTSRREKEGGTSIQFAFDLDRVDFRKLEQCNTADDSQETHDLEYKALGHENDNGRSSSTYNSHDIDGRGLESLVENDTGDECRTSKEHIIRWCDHRCVEELQCFAVSEARCQRKAGVSLNCANRLTSNS